MDPDQAGRVNNWMGQREIHTHRELARARTIKSLLSVASCRCCCCCCCCCSSESESALIQQSCLRFYRCPACNKQVTTSSPGRFASSKRRRRCPQRGRLSAEQVKIEQSQSRDARFSCKRQVRSSNSEQCRRAPRSRAPERADLCSACSRSVCVPCSSGAPFARARWSAAAR